MKFLSKIALILIVIASGCTKNKCDDPVPSISFKAFQKFGTDSAKLSINFSDCDGDIGLTEADTVPPYNYNLFLEYWERVDGEWVKLDLVPPFYYRIPTLETESSEEVLEGEIEVSLYGYYYNPFSTDSVFKYEVTLIDRALNLSNKVFSTEQTRPS